MRTFRTTTKLLAVGLAVVLAGLLAATVPASAAKKQSSEPVTLRLGYFPNVTHASAIVGVTTRTAAVPWGRDDASSRCDATAPRRSSGDRSATSSGATCR